MPPKKKRLTEIPGQSKLSFKTLAVSVDPQPSTSGANEDSAVGPGTSKEDGTTDTDNRHKRNFQTSWLSVYPWLRHEGGLMFCHVCRDAKFKNALAVGTDNFRTSTLTRHLELSEHMRLVQAPAAQAEMKTAVAQVFSKEAMAVSVAFKAVFWLCRENISLIKYQSLMELLADLKVPNIEHLSCTEHTDYRSARSANDFLEVLSDMIDEEISLKARQSPVISIMTDESTDIVVHHKLAVSIRTVDPTTLQPSTFFLTDVRLEEGTGKGIFKAIKHELDKRQIPITKVYGLGTDGASVMTGKKLGLTGQFLQVNAHLNNTHCGAHRVALVSEQAAEKVTAIKDFRDTVKNVYYYFYKSPTKAHQLESVQKILEEPTLRYKEVHSVRWLSFFEALEVIFRTLDSLLSFFETRGMGDAKAVGLKRKLGQEMFIKIAYGMLDWLQPIMRLSLLFQKKDLDIGIVKVNVNMCLMDLQKMRDGEDTQSGKPTYSDQLQNDLSDGVFKGHHHVSRNAGHFDTVKRTFLQLMMDNLESRFPNTESMAQFSVFGMRPLQFVPAHELDTWGDQDIQAIADYYTSSQKHVGEGDQEFVSEPFLKCTAADVLREWKLCKQVVKGNRYPTHSLAALWGALAALQQQSELNCPNLLQLVTLALTHPIHSCDCERTFSVQNLTVTPLRNRLSAERCDQIMRVHIEGGKLSTFDFEAAVQRWAKKCKRRVFTTKKQSSSS